MAKDKPEECVPTDGGQAAEAALAAIDNAVYLATAHFPMADISQRSYVIDPYGYPLAASHC